MSGITTHILDTSRGRPAAGVPIVLSVQEAEGWKELGRGATDADGRLRTLLPADHILLAGVYRIWFDTASYFRGHGISGFYPEVTILFTIEDAAQHYHVPLLLNPFGYSTYRGS